MMRIIRLLLLLLLCISNRLSCLNWIVILCLLLVESMVLGDIVRTGLLLIVVGPIGVVHGRGW